MLDIESYEEKTGYSSRRERFREDGQYQRDVVRGAVLAGLMVSSVFAGTVAFTGTAEAATYGQHTAETADQLEPMAQSLTDLAEESLDP